MRFGRLGEARAGLATRAECMTPPDPGRDDYFGANPVWANCRTSVVTGQGGPRLAVEPGSLSNDQPGAAVGRATVNASFEHVLSFVVNDELGDALRVDRLQRVSAPAENCERIR